MVDTLIPFIYFVSERCISKRAKMPALPNVSQINDTQARKGWGVWGSLESVLAKGSKSTWLCQDASSRRAVALGAGDLWLQLTWQLSRPLTVSQGPPWGSSCTSWATDLVKVENQLWENCPLLKNSGQIRWSEMKSSATQSAEVEFCTHCMIKFLYRTHTREKFCTQTVAVQAPRRSLLQICETKSPRDGCTSASVHRHLFS